jgi:hypothetical protein
MINYIYSYIIYYVDNMLYINIVYVIIYYILDIIYMYNMYTHIYIYIETTKHIDRMVGDLEIVGKHH